jgi:hypothetical protein
MQLSDACPLEPKRYAFYFVDRARPAVVARIRSNDSAIQITHTRTVWEPPDWSFPQDLKANGQDEILSSFRVSSYEIVLERTAMKDAQQRLGGKIGSRETDASEWLCFHGWRTKAAKL